MLGLALLEAISKATARGGLSANGRQHGQNDPNTYENRVTRSRRAYGAKRDRHTHCCYTVIGSSTILLSSVTLHQLLSQTRLALLVKPWLHRERCCRAASRSLKLLRASSSASRSSAASSLHRFTSAHTIRASSFAADSGLSSWSVTGLSAARFSRSTCSAYVPKDG